MKKISVIIPSYNRAEIVGDTVENMLRQSLSPYEVIVVDDGSTDDSMKVLRSFGDRIILVQQSNQGPGAARNVGLRIASGTFIQLMDSDDIASFNKLETQVNALIEHDADIVYSPWAKAFIEEDIVKLQDTVLQQKALPSTRTPLEYYLTGWSVVLQQCLLRKSFVEQVGLYRTDMWTCDDSDFFFRMLLKQPKIVFSEDSLTLYRLDDYGKVTGSGATGLCRVEDWGYFLLSVLEQDSRCSLLQSIISHPKFLMSIWRTIQQLEKMQSTRQTLIQKLKQSLQSNKTFVSLRLRSRTFQILEGIQYRFQGHRWSACYQTNRLSSSQQKMIQDLGYKLSPLKKIDKRAILIE